MKYAKSMCQRKPGLRCNTHAENNFIVAGVRLQESLDNFKDDPSKQYKISQANEKFRQARRDYWCSDKGLETLRENPDFAEEYKDAVNLRTNRQEGVEKISQARSELDTDKYDSVVQRQLEAVIGTADKEQIQAFQGFLDTSLERQTSVDRELRQKYTDLLDNGNTNNRILPKHIAETDNRITSIKEAQKQCSDAIERINHESEVARFRARATSSRNR